MIENILELLFPLLIVTSLITGFIVLSSIQLKSDSHDWSDKLRAFGWGMYFKKYRNEYIKPEKRHLVEIAIIINFLVLLLLLLLSLLLFINK